MKRFDISRIGFYSTFTLRLPVMKWCRLWREKMAD